MPFTEEDSRPSLPFSWGDTQRNFQIRIARIKQKIGRAPKSKRLDQQERKRLEEEFELLRRAEEYVTEIERIERCEAFLRTYHSSAATSLRDELRLRKRALLNEPLLAHAILGPSLFKEVQKFWPYLTTAEAAKVLWRPVFEKVKNKDLLGYAADSKFRLLPYDETFSTGMLESVPIA